VAEVGEERVTVDDVRREVALGRGLPASLATGGASRVEVEDALRRLVEEAYVLGEGKRRGLSVTDREVEAEVTRHRGDFPPGGLEKALAQAGLEEGVWREGIRRSLLHRKAAEAIVAERLSRVGPAGGGAPAPAAPPGARRRPGGAAGPSPAERAEKDPPPPSAARVRVRELVFVTREEAESARVLLSAGRSPEGAASLAAGKVPAVSVELGWYPVSALPAGAPAELSSLPPGGVTRVVSFSGGHAVFVVEDRLAPGAPLPAAPGGGDPSRRGEKEEALRLWLEEARGRTKVRIDEELLATLYPGRR
jgi:hypothetical protein